MSLSDLLLAEWTAFVGLVVFKLATGGIATRGMLRQERGAPIEPDRVLALCASLWVLFSYCAQVLNARGLHGALVALPDVSSTNLQLLLLGQGIYLTGKNIRSRPN